MSHDTRLRRRVMRQAAALSPDLRRQFLNAYDTLRELMDSADLERLIRESGLGAAEVMTEEMFEQAFGKLRNGVQRALESGTISAARHIVGLDPKGVFDILNPLVLDAARKLDTKVMTTLTTATRETLREAILTGLNEGVSPFTIARRVRSTIGMAQNQARAVTNFRLMLESDDLTALTRKLRDRRFDGTLRRALGPGGTGLSRSQIDRMVASYERRMIAFNANTNARTAAVDALKRGQRLSWERAMEQGIIDRERSMKRWATVGDGRVRAAHIAMNGNVVRFDELYRNGDNVPGDSTFNCRCIDVFFQAAEVEAPLVGAIG